jgi:F0F1-type ATP synthase membrane subunit b/b'
MPANKPSYYAEHRDQCKENTRIYAEKNRERIKEKQREYYQKVLKARRKRDRAYANADKPPKIKKEPVAKTTKKFFGPPIELSTVEVEIPEPLSGVTVKPGVIIDWSL